jgi:hypothetical protein
MKRPPPKTVKIILQLTLLNPDFLKELILGELYYISKLSNYQIMCFGFTAGESIRLSTAISMEISSRG